MDHTPQTIMALDVGSQRIGVALASTQNHLSYPLTTLRNTGATMTEIGDLMKEHDVGTIIVGLPRGLDGQETEQTKQIRLFIASLREHISTPIYEQDEAVTSKQAEVELRERGKPYHKDDIDALAATYILDDFLHQQETVSHGAL